MAYAFRGGVLGPVPWRGSGSQISELKEAARDFGKYTTKSSVSNPPKAAANLPSDCLMEKYKFIKSL